MDVVRVFARTCSTNIIMNLYSCTCVHMYIRACADFFALLFYFVISTVPFWLTAYSWPWNIVMWTAFSVSRLVCARSVALLSVSSTCPGFHLGPIYRGAEGKSEWNNGGGCKKNSSFFLHNFLYVVICTWCHCYRLYCRLYCILYLECWINLHYRHVSCCEYSPRASSRKRVWRTAARVGAWSFAVWRRAAGNWSPVKRGAVNFEGGGQKSKGGAAPRYVALDETLHVYSVLVTPTRYNAFIVVPCAVCQT